MLAGGWRADVRWGEMVISGGMALLAVAFFGLATFTQRINPIDPGPAAYPRLVSLLLFGFSAAQAIRSWKAGPRPADTKRGGARERAASINKYSLGTLALSILYVGFFNRAGYLVTTTVFLLGLMFLGGVRKWPVLLGVALCYGLATYYVFGEILMVPLP
jgi:putative tricarboxylic transport membrane protein